MRATPKPRGRYGQAPPTRTTTYVQHSYTVHEHRLEVPLGYSKPISPTNPKIEIFAREIIHPGEEKLPHLVFLQGGPGDKGSRQEDLRGGWIGEALKKSHIVLLGQRGTGQSTRMNWQALQELPDDQARANHLVPFRQDQIVGDAEAFRAEVIDDAKWTTPGRSYGDFLTLTYLSTVPGTVEASLMTGGLPGPVHIDNIYRLSYEKTAARNRFYFPRYPSNEQKIHEVAAHVRGTKELLPTGEHLSSGRLRMINMSLRMQSRVDILHYLLEGLFVTLRDKRRPSLEFLEGMAAGITMNPMYGMLQETIYACAVPELAGTATAWSADRLAEEVSGFAKDANPLDTSEPYYPIGEHMAHRIFNEDPALVPLTGTSDILAARTDWPAVYSPERLATNEAPIAAAVYEEGMSTPYGLSLATAQTAHNMRTRITNEYQHDNLRASSGGVFAHLLELLRD